MGVFLRLYRVTSFLLALQEKGQSSYKGCTDKTLAALKRVGSNKLEKMKRDE